MGINQFDTFTAAEIPELLKTAGNRHLHKIWLHCSASDNPNHDNAQTMDRWHRQKGWNEIGYHIFMSKGGVMQMGRGWNKTPAAHRPENRRSMAICLHGLEVDKFTGIQEQVLNVAARAFDQGIQHLRGYRPTFHGHREVAAKLCPVFDYRRWLNLDATGFMRGTAVPYQPEPEDPDPPRNQYDLGNVRIFDRGQNVQAVQRMLNTHGYGVAVDGIFGRNTHRAVLLFQEEHDLDVDGIVGKFTWEALAGPVE